MAISNETVVSLREPLGELSDLVLNQLSGPEVNELIGIVNKVNEIMSPRAIEHLRECTSSLQNVVHICRTVGWFAQHFDSIRYNYRRDVENYFGSKEVVRPSADKIQEDVANRIYNFIMDALAERTEVLSNSTKTRTIEDAVLEFAVDFVSMNFPIEKSPIYTNDYDSPVYDADDFFKRGNHIDDFFAPNEYKTASKVFGDVDAYKQAVNDMAELAESLEYVNRVLKIRRNSWAEVESMAASAVPKLPFLWFSWSTDNLHKAAKRGRFDEENERELSLILGVTQKQMRDILCVDALRNEAIINAIDGWSSMIRLLLSGRLGDKVSIKSVGTMMEAACDIADAEIIIADGLRHVLDEMMVKNFPSERDIFADLLRDFVAESMNKLAGDFENFAMNDDEIVRIVNDRDNIRAVVDFIKQRVGDETDNVVANIVNSNNFVFMSDVSYAISRDGGLAKSTVETEDMVKDVRSLRPVITEPFSGLSSFGADIEEARDYVANVDKTGTFRTAMLSADGSFLLRFDNLCGAIKAIAQSDPGYRGVVD